MVYKFEDSKERRIDDDFKIKDIFPTKNQPIDFVICDLDGFHGTFINRKSVKHYFLLEGYVEIYLNDEKHELNKYDFIEVPVGVKHCLKRKGNLALICSPSYDFKYEEIVN